MSAIVDIPNLASDDFTSASQHYTTYRSVSICKLASGQFVDARVKPGHDEFTYSAATCRREGAGTGRPSARASAIQAAMASRTLASAASAVSPSDMQPGKSGKVAMKPPPLAIWRRPVIVFDRLSSGGT